MINMMLNGMTFSPYSHGTRVRVSKAIKIDPAATRIESTLEPLTVNVMLRIAVIQSIRVQCIRCLTGLAKWHEMIAFS